MDLNNTIKTVLESNFWITTLKPDMYYFITNDDCDSNLKQGMSVVIDNQGDAWITINGDRGMASCRIRTFAGGGHNHRTRNALMILAEAIRLDNEGNKYE